MVNCECEWLDWIVRDLLGERLEGWGQGGLGKRHVDGSMRVAIKCTLWLLENISFLCFKQLNSMLYMGNTIPKFNFFVLTYIFLEQVGHYMCKV